MDHVAVAEGLGCKALRVFKPEEIAPALKRAQAMAAEHQVPVVVEMILERVTNIAMGTKIDVINEFKELAEKKGGCADRRHAARLNDEHFTDRPIG